METFLVIAIIILDLAGAIWLGIVDEHPVLTPLSYIILIVIISLVDKSFNVVLIIMIIGAAATVIAFIIVMSILIVSKIKERKGIKRDIDLLNAVNTRDLETAKKLIEEGAYINYSSTILRTAIKNNDKEMVSFLIEKGAYINIISDNKTPLDYAENEEIIEILKNKGAKTKSEIDEERKKEAEEQVNLGIRYSFGFFDTPQDDTKAVECFK
jgi:hypothetical protein